ncbi:hypothetical protein Q8F55_005369 [Vanrija albida]|uniref:NAD+ kinase n=1 Tax=Vanrija albida TaxID=181172 RepID=A0ABR3Q265_9TREE
MASSDVRQQQVGYDFSNRASPATTQRVTIATGPAPSSSRLRSPQPPSPLSQMADTNGSSDTVAAPAPKKQGKSVKIADDDDNTPCFIHSQLDKHGSLSDWLRKGEHHFFGSPPVASKPKAREVNFDDGTQDAPLPPPHSRSRRANIKPLTPAQPVQPRQTSPPSSAVSEYDSDKSSRLDSSAVFEDVLDSDEDDEEVSSLTRQLAATAQGVREVSKELGRTTVRSRIQSVLIVTKARDNRLIKLTRELALYLMENGKPKVPYSTAPSAAASANSSTTDLTRLPRQAESRNRGMIVYVDAQLRHSKRFDAAGMETEYPHLFEPVARRRGSSASASTWNLSSSMSNSGYLSSTSTDTNYRRREEGQLRYWTAEMCSNSPHLFDFVVTLGGDGTVLFTSWLFQKIVPPVLPFALGSLGFLTNFDFANYRPTMDRVINEGIRVNLRMRFTCVVYRAVEQIEDRPSKGGKRRNKAVRRPGGDILVQQVDRDGWDALEDPSDTKLSSQKGKHKEIMCYTTRAVEQFEVLNDLVVDRGPSPFVSLLEVFGDDHHLTTVQADGLTVSTPTGSTAYSLSAGGSLVHPQIPAILLTPICPHTLSFRPMLLPDSMELRICVPYNSRSTAWASFDGRGRVELKQGDHIKITASRYPFPTVCADKQSTDWFRSISRTLKWNEREKQKSFVVVEEDHRSGAKPLRPRDQGTSSSDDRSHTEGEDETDTEDEFDIDDVSGGETPPLPTQKSSTSLPTISRVQSLKESNRDKADALKSGVQSPSRFASAYDGPPPLSKRHLLEKLANVERQLAQADLHDELDDPNDHLGPLPGTESDGTLSGPDNLDHKSRPRTRRADSDFDDVRTPRQGRSRSRSRVRAASKTRGESPSVQRRPSAFAFFGNDSQSELSDHSD